MLGVAALGVLPLSDIPQAGGSPGAYTLSIDPPSYALTVSNVGLTAARTMSITAPSYALSVSDASLLAGRAVSITAPSYALSVSNLTLLADRLCSISAAAYSVTIPAVSLLAGRSLSIDPASYVLTIPDLTFETTSVATETSSAYGVLPNRKRKKWHYVEVPSVSEPRMEALAERFEEAPQRKKPATKEEGEAALQRAVDALVSAEVAREARQDTELRLINERIERDLALWKASQRERDAMALRAAFERAALERILALAIEEEEAVAAWLIVDGL
jgi:hypothetical protein